MQVALLLRATDFYWMVVPVILCRVAVLFTLFGVSSISPLPGGSVIYPVEGEVKYSFAGWQGSIRRVAICPRLRPDIPFVSAAWSIFWIFSFLFRYFLLGSVYSRVFSLACLIFLFYFPNSFTVIGLFLFRYPLQELQKATTWGDMCGSRRERMVTATVIFKS